MPVPGAVLLWLCPGGLVSEPQGRLVFNEINTIPGFTEHSRFPDDDEGGGTPLWGTAVPHDRGGDGTVKQLLLTAHAIHAGPLILVNRQYPYRESGGDSPGTGGETPERMERRAAALLSMLMEEIGGWRQITAVSGWGPGRSSRPSGTSPFTTMALRLPGPMWRSRDTANTRPGWPSIWG